MSSFFDSLLNKVGETDPQYVKTQQVWRGLAVTGSVCSIACLVTTVGLTILGLNKYAAGKIYEGSSLIFRNVALSCFFYNCYRASNNLQQVADSPISYSNRNPLQPAYDHKKIKECVLKDTFFFEWFVDLVIFIVQQRNA